MTDELLCRLSLIASLFMIVMFILNMIVNVCYVQKMKDRDRDAEHADPS